MLYHFDDSSHLIPIISHIMYGHHHQQINTKSTKSRCRKKYAKRMPKLSNMDARRGPKINKSRQKGRSRKELKQYRKNAKQKIAGVKHLRKTEITRKLN